jgi:hypothetical protein
MVGDRAVGLGFHACPEGASRMPATTGSGMPRTDVIQ